MDFLDVLSTTLPSWKIHLIMMWLDCVGMSLLSKQKFLESRSSRPRYRHWNPRQLDLWPVHWWDKDRLSYKSFKEKSALSSNTSLYSAVFCQWLLSLIWQGEYLRQPWEMPWLSTKKALFHPVTCQETQGGSNPTTGIASRPGVQPTPEIVFSGCLAPRRPTLITGEGLRRFVSQYFVFYLFSQVRHTLLYDPSLYRSLGASLKVQVVRWTNRCVDFS